MAQDIYLYRDKIQIAMADGKGHQLGAISVPRGKKKNDEFFGPTEVIYDQVDVSVYDVSGRRVAKLVDAVVEAGYHTVSWPSGHGAAQAAGVYFVRLESSKEKSVKRIVRIR